jgi:thioredoxin-dependent peroxiredoxin
VAKGPQPGDPAPDFELEGTEGPFRLSDHRGERVVLLFYPGDETPVCTKQFCSYRDNADEMAELDATIVGISPQDLDSHRSFIDHHGLTVPLLADTDVKVSKAYGVTRPWKAGRHWVPKLGTGSSRAAFVIDEEGIVRFRHDALLDATFLQVDELREALRALPVP